MADQLQIVLALPDAGKGQFQTEYIQKALDTCRDAGGGEVALSAGEWHIASLRLYSGTTLHLLSGAHVIASDKWQDYTDFHIDSTLGYLRSPFVIKAWNLPPYYVYSPITAAGAENVAVIGDADSWFDGSDCFDPHGEEHFRGPMGMTFSRCRNVTLKGYTYKNAANWCHQLDSCTNVRMENVTVRGGHDGINIHHCVNVRISGCDFETGDDCVAGYDAENVVIRNCSFNTACSSFRIGAKNLLVENCRFWGPGVYPHRVSGRHNTLCGFEYYAMEYDDIQRDSENWLIRNCSFENLDTLIHYDYGNNWMHNGRPLRDVTFENVTMKGLLGPSQLHALPEAPLKARFKNVTVTWREGKMPGGLIDASEDVEFTLQNVKAEGLSVPFVLNG